MKLLHIAGYYKQQKTEKLSNKNSIISKLNLSGHNMIINRYTQIIAIKFGKINKTAIKGMYGNQSRIRGGH